jgi:hypothetical protein
MLKLYEVPIPVTIRVRAEGPAEAEHAAMDYMDTLTLQDSMELIEGIGYTMDSTVMAREVDE